MTRQTYPLHRIARLAALCLLLVAAGCQMALPLRLAAGPARLAVLDGAVTVVAPRGYCIDPAASLHDADTAVVLIGRCRTDARSAAQVAAVVTVSVGPGGSAGVMTAGGAALSAFFTSDQGRALLARSGRAADVQVIQARARDDAFVMQVADRSAGVYWRAVTGIGGRLVTVSASGAEGADLAPEAGLPLVESTLAALRAANPVSRP